MIGPDFLREQATECNAIANALSGKDVRARGEVLEVAADLCRLADKLDGKPELPKTSVQAPRAGSDLARLPVLLHKQRRPHSSG